MFICLIADAADVHSQSWPLHSLLSVRSFSAINAVSERAMMLFRTADQKTLISEQINTSNFPFCNRNMLLACYNDTAVTSASGFRAYVFPIAYQSEVVMFTILLDTTIFRFLEMEPAWDFASYRNVEQRMLRRAGANAQTRQRIHCSHTQSMDVVRDSDK